jgi:hypothetical protein
VDTGGLEPLAHLQGLTELFMDHQCLKSAQPVAQLLSSAVQGCRLKVRLPDTGYDDDWFSLGEVSMSESVTNQVISAHATLKAERGSRLVPQLEVVGPRMAGLPLDTFALDFAGL